VLLRAGRPRILLVGGHPLLAAMFSEQLHRGDCHELEPVQYCDDALGLLQSRPFDLVLVLSLHVPWRRWPRGYSPRRHIGLANAILFLKRLRALQSPPPVILISGSPLAESEQEALANGAFAFIRKPFDLAELDRFVRLALESRTGVR
jgi:CheY-like chemotaxis protein